MENAAAEGWSGGGGGAEAVLGLSAGSSIPLCYHSSFGPHDDLLLLEVDEKLLPDILHNRVSIRGQPDEEAVLCTTSATYAMKFVGTSNSVFLVPPGDAISPNVNGLCSNGVTDDLKTPEPAVFVLKVALGSIELVQAAPRIDKLKYLLNERRYRLEEDLEHDAMVKTGLYRWQDLIKQVQASEEELRTALRSLSAVEIDGYWRIVDDKAMDVVLNVILNNSLLNGWALQALEEDRVASVLEIDGFPRRIVIHCLETFGSKVESAAGGIWSLDEKLVCVRVARRILNGGKMKLESFVEKWMSSIPPVMSADLSMLKGEVLYEKLGVESWICAFSVASLPSTPAERFASLFRERPKWDWKDLEPYIRDLRVPGLTSEGLLIKYTRRTQPNAEAEPIFSAR